jgi:hypothetical protein
VYSWSEVSIALRLVLLGAPLSALATLGCPPGTYYREPDLPAAFEPLDVDDCILFPPIPALTRRRVIAAACADPAICEVDVAPDRRDLVVHARSPGETYVDVTFEELTTHLRYARRARVTFNPIPRADWLHPRYTRASRCPHELADAAAE